MELREQIEDILVKVYDMGRCSKDEPSVRQATLEWAILEINNLSLVQLDENQELPKNKYAGWEDKPGSQWYPFAMADERAKQDMVDEGFRRVK